MFVYVGTYTESPQGHGEGIYVFRFQPETGELNLVETIPATPNPSFLAIGAQGRHLYAVNEDDEGRITAFARDYESGTLSELNRRSTHGSGPCYVSLDLANRYVLVANYGSGNLAVLPIGEDGELYPATDVVQHEGTGANEQRQNGPHAHMIAATPNGDWILAADLGTDSVITYRLDTSAGTLDRVAEAAAHTPGAGPRHFAFAASGHIVYVINELDSTLTSYTIDAETGALTTLQTVPSLPDGFDGDNTCAQVVVSPDGRFVYGSNRGHDSIVVWGVDEDAGRLSVLGHMSTGGKNPRNFNIDPSGQWLLVANQGSDSIITFQRDSESGLLTETGLKTTVPTPVAIVFRDVLP